eukprot:GHRQ01027841.1.p2 GENE.GHRQ01027841.1~~GHRQ01027841.1.p2  ORF type:complete len:132 (+),score=20.13 GHRQ01027841.1:304-699(+)
MLPRCGQGRPSSVGQHQQLSTACRARLSLPASKALRGSHRRALLVRAQYDSSDTDLLGPHFHNRARISEEVMQSLVELPGTTGIAELRQRAEDLTTWKLSLQRGWVHLVVSFDVHRLSCSCTCSCSCDCTP